MQRPRAIQPPVQDSADSSMLLNLAPNLDVDPDSVLGKVIAGFGLPDSGKTTVAALLAEQFGKLFVPMVVFDCEGDFLTLPSVLPHGVVGTYDNCPSGWDVLNQGLQVVYDLSTCPTGVDQAELITTVIRQLLSWANARPNHERVPCLVLLDEAAKWLPQGKGTEFEKETYNDLRETFRVLGEQGRKRGMTPAYFTPRISQLNKSVLFPGMYILMRQALHTDLDLYLEYITPVGDLTARQLKNRIQAFGRGRAIVKLPGGAQKSVVFNNRQSEHVSHTPRVQAAINRYANIPFNAAHSYGALMPSPEKTDNLSVLPTQAPAPETVTKPSRKRVTKRRSASAYRQVVRLLKKNDSLSAGTLAEMTGCTVRTAGEYRRRYLSTVKK